jgi:hypothetical protein
MALTLESEDIAGVLVVAKLLMGALSDVSLWRPSCLAVGTL